MLLLCVFIRFINFNCVRAFVTNACLQINVKYKKKPTDLNEESSQISSVCFEGVGMGGGGGMLRKERE